jgi:ATPase
MKMYLPDTSAIIDGTVSKMIEKGEIKEAKILIHLAVVSELEYQANYGRETGFLGLTELKKLNDLKSDKIIIQHVGERPNEFQIKYAKSGEIDSMIRETARTMGATFITLDRVDAEAGKALGIDVLFIEVEKIKRVLSFEKYFDGHTMSVHLREGAIPSAKKGVPGNWRMELVGNERLTAEQVEDMAKEIVEEGKMRIDGSFLETERRWSTVAQIRDYRIVITKPPFADGWEITIVTPIHRMDLKDYKLDKKIMDLLETKAEGILISGAPGNGKTTFAQALAESYLARKKIVKTVEAPRDLRLPNEITQYSKALGSMDEIRDVLLLSRPDYTIFDEMRNNQDFLLFADMRLSGVGMVGVVHATSPIDAIQRFINRVELGVIPSIIDTVIFIQNGNVGKVYSLSMTVKVPSGMVESDLARPVIEIKDFFSGQPEYEMYTYGEMTVVMPVVKQIGDMAEKVKRAIGVDAEVEIKGGVAMVYVKHTMVKRLIGKGGRHINQLEKRLGIPIEVVGY